MPSPLTCAFWAVWALVFVRLAGPIAAADTIYVSNEKDNTITVVDGDSLTAVKTIPVGQRPRGIVLSSDQKSLYICASDSDHIEVLDLASEKVVRTLPSGTDPDSSRSTRRASCSTSPTRTTVWSPSSTSHRATS